jgi:Sister chromatid cohesion protein Dcc1
MATSLDMLRGEVLVLGPGGTGGTRGLKKFPVSALPADAGDRFKELFEERPRWEAEDLEPYVEGLGGPGKTVEGLLLKYARANQQRPTDPVTYSKRL